MKLDLVARSHSHQPSISGQARKPMAVRGTPDSQDRFGSQQVNVLGVRSETTSNYRQFTRQSGGRNTWPRAAQDALALSNSESQHENVIQTWTLESPLYKTVRGALLTDDAQVLKEYGSYIFDLKESLRQLGNGKQGWFEGIQWRAMNLSPEQLKSYQAGTRIMWPTFSSTSKNRSKAEKFGSTLFRIETPGVGLTYNLDVQSFSHYPVEEEVLFFPYTCFEVEKVESHVIFLKAYDRKLVDGS